MRSPESTAAVPEALAHVRTRGGEEVVATRFLAGRALGEALAAEPGPRRALLLTVGRLVRALHAAGRVHRDLHAENVWVASDGPVLIDLQQSLPFAPGWLRRRDQGELDASLAGHLSLADRVRLRAALLGIARPFDARGRAAVRAIAVGGRGSELKIAAFHLRMTRLTVAALRNEQLDIERPLSEPVGTERERQIALVLSQVWFSALLAWAAGLHSVDVVTQRLRDTASLILGEGGEG